MESKLQFPEGLLDSSTAKKGRPARSKSINSLRQMWKLMNAFLHKAAGARTQQPMRASGANSPVLRALAHS
eukprot:6182420-Pleurochrysis_carterae.AAC.2